MKKSTVLILAGGSPHAHDFIANGASLATTVADAGHEVSLVAHPDEAAPRLEASVNGSNDVDALIINGLWWRMQGEAYDRWRPDHGYHTSKAWMSAVSQFVSSGGGLLAMHTTPICFDDWPEWREVVGGSWQWGTSSHPPLGQVEADVLPGHQVVAGLPDRLRVVDEVYGDLDVCPEVDVFLQARRSPDDVLQPIGWTYRYGLGRVVFDGLGHNVASLENADHQRLIVRALNWVLAGR